MRLMSGSGSGSGIVLKGRRCSCCYCRNDSLIDLVLAVVRDDRSSRRGRNGFKD